MSLNSLSPQFGGKVRPTDLDRFKKSKHWDGKKFNNQIETSMSISFWEAPKLIKDNLTNTKVRSPRHDLKYIPFDETKFQSADTAPKFVWYGHSALLLQVAEKNLLIDPMLGPNASPIGPITTKRFNENSLNIVDELPALDAILITHDHYDHLDLTSIKKLKDKCDTWLVALGVKRHLERWGINPDFITEFDWWDEFALGKIEITFTPSRHFSGRGLTDRAKSLWGGWVFKTPEHNIYWSGDGGYGPHFKEIGKKLGPFDWGFMECGQYNKNWHSIHMYPEESVQAAIDAGVKTATAVHWGGFSLALHTWKDPIERFVAEAEKLQVQISTPQLGEIVNMNDPVAQNYWWEPLE